MLNVHLFRVNILPCNLKSLNISKILNLMCGYLLSHKSEKSTGETFSSFFCIYIYVYIHVCIMKLLSEVGERVERLLFKWFNLKFNQRIWLIKSNKYFEHNYQKDFVCRKHWPKSLNYSVHLFKVLIHQNLSYRVIISMLTRWLNI